MSDVKLLASTVAVLRDGGNGIETLMLRKNSRIAFGGMWVFPGGRIDPEDYQHSHTTKNDELSVARVAAAREAKEEAAIELAPQSLIHFSHWLPPAQAKKRFSTWFFVAKAGEEQIQIDDGEIVEYEWMCPGDALAKCDTGEIELAPPTWVSLHTFQDFATAEELMISLSKRTPSHYETRMTRGEEGFVALWSGDAGYDTSDAKVPGARHRLERQKQGYRFYKHP